MASVCFVVVEIDAAVVTNVDFAVHLALLEAAEVRAWASSGRRSQREQIRFVAASTGAGRGKDARLVGRHRRRARPEFEGPLGRRRAQG